MGQVERDFDSHPLWGAVTTLGQRLDAAPELEEPDAIEHLARLRWLHERLLALRDLDPKTVPVSVLNNLQNTLSSIDSSVSQFVSSPASWPSYLTPAAMQYTDQILTFLAQFPSDPNADVRAAEAAATDAIARTTAALTLIQQRVVELERKIDEQAQASAAAVESQQEASSNAIATLEAQQASQEGKVQSLIATIGEQATSLTTALAAHQTAFTEALAGVQSAADEQAAKIKKDAEAAREAQSQAADTHMKALAKFQEQAEAVVQNTGRRAITTEYGQYAKAERKSALVWSVLTVLFALGGFGFILFELQDAADASASWQETLLKATGSLALLGAAGYSGKQASEHRQQERDAKRTQLDINAVEPFLARLPEEKQDELRAAIADRVFARRALHGSPEAGGPPIDFDAAGLIGKGIKAFTEKN